MQAKHAYRNSHILLPPDNVCMSIICSHFPPEPIVRCNAPSCCAPSPRLFPTGQSCNHSRITFAIAAIKCHPREKGTTTTKGNTQSDADNLSPTCQPFFGRRAKTLLIIGQLNSDEYQGFRGKTYLCHIPLLGNLTKT